MPLYNPPSGSTGPVIDAIDGLNPSTGDMFYFTGADTTEVFATTSFTRDLMASADATEVVTALGLAGSDGGSYAGPEDLIQLKRGTTAQRLLITPEEGEIVYDTDMKAVFVGDGSTVGGVQEGAPYLDVEIVGANIRDFHVVGSTPVTLIPQGATGRVVYAPSKGLAISSLTFSNLNLALVALPSVTSITFHNIVVCTGGITLSSLTGITHLGFPALEVVGGTFNMSGAALTTFDLSALREVGILSIASATLTAFSFPALETITTQFILQSSTSVTSVSMPSLVYCGGNFGATSGVNVLSSVSAPELLYVMGTLSHGGFSGATAMTSLTYTKLIQVGALTLNYMASLSTLNLSALRVCSGALTIDRFGSLATLSLPALEYTGDVAIGSTNTGIITLSLPSLISFEGAVNVLCTNITTVTIGTSSTFKKGGTGFISFTGGKLTQASVDHILAQYALLDGTNGTTLFGTGRTLQLTGGTNAAPSAAGLVSKAIITGRGATVLHN